MNFQMIVLGVSIMVIVMAGFVLLLCLASLSVLFAEIGLDIFYRVLMRCRFGGMMYRFGNFIRIANLKAEDQYLKIAARLRFGKVQPSFVYLKSSQFLVCYVGFYVTIIAVSFLIGKIAFNFITF